MVFPSSGEDFSPVPSSVGDLEVAKDGRTEASEGFTGLRPFIFGLKEAEASGSWHS